MNKPEVTEAVPIVQRLCNNLSANIPDKGTAGVTARAAIGQVYAFAASLCQSNSIMAALDNCFELVRQTGCTVQQMETIRIQTTVEAPTTLGATLLVDCSIQLALAQEAKIIGAMVFTSRQDVDAMITAIQPAFADAIEVAADTMDAMVFRGLVELQAAITNHLVQTARPLPAMLDYQFAQPLPSLVISYKLYGDARRYDEIRNENKVVHPAFCPPLGRALAS